MEAFESCCSICLQFATIVFSNKTSWFFYNTTVIKLGLLSSKFIINQPSSSGSARVRNSQFECKVVLFRPRSPLLIVKISRLGLILGLLLLPSCSVVHPLLGTLVLYLSRQNSSSRQATTDILLATLRRQWPGRIILMCYKVHWRYLSFGPYEIT